MLWASVFVSIKKLVLRFAFVAVRSPLFLISCRCDVWSLLLVVMVCGCVLCFGVLIRRRPWCRRLVVFCVLHLYCWRLLFHVDC